MHYTIQINSYEILNPIKYHMEQSQIIHTQLSHIKKGLNPDYSKSKSSHRSPFSSLHHYRGYPSTLLLPLL